MILTFSQIYFTPAKININENNIEEVIAFKDSDAENFSLIPNPKLHVEKIDLSKIDLKYKFKDVDDLINNWA